MLLVCNALQPSELDNLIFFLDMDVRQMENAAIMASAWQRPSFIIDPYDEGREFITEYSRVMLRKNLVTVDDNVYVTVYYLSCALDDISDYCILPIMCS